MRVCSANDFSKLFGYGTGISVFFMLSLYNRSIVPPPETNHFAILAMFALGVDYLFAHR